MLNNVYRSHFYLEPKILNIDLDYVDDEAFTAFPQQAAFFTPCDVNECDMIVEGYGGTAGAQDSVWRIA